MTTTKTLTGFLLALTLNFSPAIANVDLILGFQTLGNGPEKVIVLPNWMRDAENYATVHPWLDPIAFTYVFADVRGYGQSKDLQGNYDTDIVAGDIIALADHLGWQRFSLVGHSMNGMAGFKALMRDWQGPRRIKRFVAVTPVTPDGYPATDEDKAFLTSTITDDEMAIAAFGALTGGKLNTTRAARKTARNRATSRPDAVKAYYDMWVAEDFSREFAAAKIETPVRVIGGRNDLPGFQEAHYDETLAKWLVNVDFAYIDNAGHCPLQETPVLLATLVEAHLTPAR